MHTVVRISSTSFAVVQQASTANPVENGTILNGTVIATTGSVNQANTVAKALNDLSA